MKVGVVVFPGSNCDRDAFVAVKKITGQDAVRLWHKDTNIPDLDLVIVPGGFSYGDYLRSGAIASKSPIMSEIIARANKGMNLLGICNGFQILTETGLLPGTLLRNRDLKFICREVNLKVVNNKSKFTGGYSDDEIIKLPVAHHDGNYFADSATLAEMENNGQILFKYTNESGELTEATSPNGSIHNIAGITNKAGNVLGMMPHPERHVDIATGGTDGTKLFQYLLNKIS